MMRVNLVSTIDIICCGIKVCVDQRRWKSFPATLRQPRPSDWLTFCLFLMMHMTLLLSIWPFAIFSRCVWSSRRAHVTYRSICYTLHPLPMPDGWLLIFINMYMCNQHVCKLSTIHFLLGDHESLNWTLLEKNNYLKKQQV